jgi:4-diphosphocytidyl-2-C-methyl-D-erythritol kinase
MHSYSLIAPAKINLYLEIIGDRPDGFHELVMILQSVELADYIDLEPNGTDLISLHCDSPQVPLDSTNLAYKAVELLKQEFPDRFANFGGVDITIEKNIPVAAGLAGGSTNGAAVLVGMNMMWQLGLTVPELQDLAARLGSDVPFCISGGTAIATGRGEQLDSIADLDHLWVVLAKYNNLGVSTVWAYQTYRQQFGDTYIGDRQGIKSRTSQIHSGPLVNAICHKNSVEIGKLLHNDLEKVVLPQYPQVQQLREAFSNTDILGTMMSGSGPTVFALCESQIQAETVTQQVREAIPDPNLQFWITKLSSQGIQVET